MNYLTKKEFDEFKNNDFAHLRNDVTGIKRDVNWIRWLLCTLWGAILVRVVLLFFGI